MNTYQTINIIADNGGGITLQIIGGEEDYQHYFPSGEHAAETVKDAIDNKLSDSADEIQIGWEGNNLDDGESLLVPSDEEVRNGGYYIIDNIESFHDLFSHEGAYGHNIQELVDGVYSLVMAEANV